MADVVQGPFYSDQGLESAFMVTVLLLASCGPMLAFSLVRRCNDAGLSPWWAIASFAVLFAPYLVWTIVFSSSGNSSPPGLIWLLFDLGLLGFLVLGVLPSVPVDPLLPIASDAPLVRVFFWQLKPGFWWGFLLLPVIIASLVWIGRNHVEGYRQRNAEDVSVAAAAANPAAANPADTPEAGATYSSPLAAGGFGPTMVVVPAGQFQMGSPSDEVGRRSSEGPVHSVSIRRFAMGKYPVTRAEFAAFVAATGYQTDAEKNTPIELGETVSAGCNDTAGTSWRNPGFPQDDNHPAVCLSWNDARAYVQWLAGQTGKRYRLPSEAEAEYAIRAGSTSPYPWGTDPDFACRYANILDTAAKAQLPAGAATTVNCNDGYVFTSPVGHFQPNAFGLYDTDGNVLTWTEDCGKKDYYGAPTDGSAWVWDGCGPRVVRGASFIDPPANFRSAGRRGRPPAARGTFVGLRVAQDL